MCVTLIYTPRSKRRSFDQLKKYFIVIEAEVRYAVRNEYAQTAVDVVARRCRLAFLNAQATLDALPRIVDIMAEELNWNTDRKKRELQRGVEFLSQSMGLINGLEFELSPRSWTEWTKSLVWGWKPRLNGRSTQYNRAQFEAGEVDELRAKFSVRAKEQARITIEMEGQLRLQKDDVGAILNEIEFPGYDGIKDKDLEYILAETGLADRHDFDFDEFVEVRSSVLFLFYLTIRGTDLFFRRYVQASKKLPCARL